MNIPVPRAQCHTCANTTRLELSLTVFGTDRLACSWQNEREDSFRGFRYVDATLLKHVKL